MSEMINDEKWKSITMKMVRYAGVFLAGLGAIPGYEWALALSQLLA